MKADLMTNSVSQDSIITCSRDNLYTFRWYTQSALFGTEYKL